MMLAGRVLGSLVGMVAVLVFAILVAWAVR